MLRGRHKVFSYFLLTPPPTPDFFPLSLHDALPISVCLRTSCTTWLLNWAYFSSDSAPTDEKNRKSTRLNSSHTVISYAVFCLKKKKKKKKKKCNQNRH